MSDAHRNAAPAWNFFNRTATPDLWCAVPVDRRIPDFLLSGAWGFGGDRIEPGGFRVEQALDGDELNGFYLFQRVADARGEMPRSA